MGSYIKELEPTSKDHSSDVLYTIKKSDYVGRYMVAARDILPGETIFTDQPACIGDLLYSSLVSIEHYSISIQLSGSTDLDIWM